MHNIAYHGSLLQQSQVSPTSTRKQLIPTNECKNRQQLIPTNERKNRQCSLGCQMGSFCWRKNNDIETMILDFNTNTKTEIWVDGEFLYGVPTCHHIRLGSSLCPLHFCVVMEKIIESIKNWRSDCIVIYNIKYVLYCKE